MSLLKYIIIPMFNWLVKLVAIFTTSEKKTLREKKIFHSFWLKSKAFVFPLICCNILFLDWFFDRPFFYTCIKISLVSLFHYILLYWLPYVFDTKYYFLWNDIKKFESQNKTVVPVKNSVQILLLIWTIFVYCCYGFVGYFFKFTLILTGCFTGLSYLLCLFINIINLYKMPKLPQRLFILHGVHVRWMPIFGVLNKGVPLCRNVLLLVGTVGLTSELSWKAAHGHMWVSPWRGAAANYVFDRPFGYRWTEIELNRAGFDSILDHNESLYKNLGVEDPNPPISLETLKHKVDSITTSETVAGDKGLLRENADLRVKIQRLEDLLDKK